MSYKITEEHNGIHQAMRLETAEGVPSLLICPSMGGNVLEWWVGHPQKERVNLIYVPDDPVKEWTVNHHLFGLPFLFPFANRVWSEGEEGWYEWKGKRYEMPCHGFAFWMPWKLVERKEDRSSASITLELVATPDTLQKYPWSFTVMTTFTLSGNTLFIEQDFTNLSDTPMPLSPGWHPYFNTPLVPEGSKDACVLHIPVRSEIKIEKGTRPTGEVRPFQKCEVTLKDWGLPPRFVTDLMEPYVSIADPAAGIEVQLDLRSPEGSLGYPYILTWTKSEEAPFFCIEPYEGLTDAINNKKGLRLLPPESSYRSSLRLNALTG